MDRADNVVEVIRWLKASGNAEPAMLADLLSDQVLGVAAADNLTVEQQSALTAALLGEVASWATAATDLLGSPDAEPRDA